MTAAASGGRALLLILSGGALGGELIRHSVYGVCCESKRSSSLRQLGQSFPGSKLEVVQPFDALNLLGPPRHDL